MNSLRVFRPNNRCFFIIFAICMATACAESPTTPVNEEIPRNLRPVPSPDLSSGGDNQSILVIDEFGESSLTLDIPSHEIRYGDGRVFTLTAQETADATTDFQGTIDYDLLSNSALNSLCTPANPCDLESAPIRGGEGQVQVVLRKVKSDHPKKQAGGQFGIHIRSIGNFNKALAQTLKTRGAPGQVTANNALGWPSTCSAMQRDIVTAVTAYRDQRRSVLRNFIDVAIGFFGFDIERQKLVLTSLSEMGQTVSAAALGLYAQKRYTETEMTIMRTLYTSAGCGTVTWSGPGGGGGGNTYGWNLVCHNETWQISVSGGAYSNIEVSVCAYED